MKKRNSMCVFEDCEWTKHKDSLCRQHWQTFFGHEAKGQVFGRCEVCNCPIDADYTYQNYCPTKLLERKEDIVGRIEKMQDELLEYAGEKIVEAQEQSLEQVNAALAAEAEVAQWAMEMAPPCPDCHRHDCVNWFKKWFKWVREHVLGATGMLNVLYVLLVRAGGEIEVPLIEAQEAQNSFTHTTCWYDRDAQMIVLKAHTFEDQHSEPFVKASINPSLAPNTVEWPDIVGDTESKDEPPA